MMGLQTVHKQFVVVKSIYQYFYALLFHSLEFDIEFNIANSSEYQGTASASVTFEFFMFFIFLSLYQSLKQTEAAFICPFPE